MYFKSFQLRKIKWQKEKEKNYKKFRFLGIKIFPLISKNYTIFVIPLTLTAIL